MARRILDIGDSANDGTGDSIRVAAIKLNETLSEVYNYFGNGSVLTFGTLTSSTSGNTVLGGDSFRVVGNTGQVSIGTDNPTVLFQVSSSSGVTSYTDQVSDVFKIEGNTDQGINISTGDSSNGYIAFSNTSTRAAGALGYDQGLNSLTIFTDNTERLRVDGSGNVGIGTASPLGRLHVERAAASAGWVIRGQTASVSNESGLYMDASNNIELAVRDGSGTLTAAVKSSGDTFFNGGNVGIGTTSPAEKLHIAGGSTAGSLIVSESTSTSQFSGGGIALMNGATSNDSHVLISTTIRDSDGSDSVFVINQIDGNRGYLKTLAQYDLSDHFWRFLTNNVERMRITETGRVGIGTTTPDTLLDVEGGNAKFGVTGTGGGRLIVDSLTDNVMRLSVNRTGTTGQLAFHTGADTEHMRIGSTGNVDIGAQSPIDGGRYLDITNTNGEATNFSVIRLITQQVGSTSTTSADLFKRKNGQLTLSNNDTNPAAYLSLKVGTSERMRINSSGNVGVGTNSPSYKLDVAGTIHSSTGGFRFPDGSTQTTAGLEVPNGKSIAFALIFG